MGDVKEQARGMKTRGDWRERKEDSIYWIWPRSKETFEGFYTREAYITFLAKTSEKHFKLSQFIVCTLWIHLNLLFA